MRRTAPVSALVLAVLLGATARAEEPMEKIELPGVSVPTLDLGLTVPDMDGMEGRAVEATSAPKAPSVVTYTLGEVRLGRRFSVRAGKGCVAKESLQGFVLPVVPANAAPFQSCVRLTASQGVVASFKAQIRDPNDKVVAEASGEVSFARSSSVLDYVVDWSGFPARMTGTYRMVVYVGGTRLGAHTFEVKGP